jgi:hypothetical protein
VCIYDCALDGGDVPLPATIRFDVGQQQDAWSETLTTINQLFSGYADRDHRQFTVIVPGWNAPVDANAAGRCNCRDPENATHGTLARVPLVCPLGPRAGDVCALRSYDGLNAVEVSEANGHVEQLSLCAHRPGGSAADDDSAEIQKAEPRQHRITLPGQVAGDTVRYQYLGARKYWPGLARITNGQLLLEPRNRMAVLWTGGFLIGGGPALEYNSRWIPSGRLQLAARFQPAESWPWWEFSANARWSAAEYVPLNVLRNPNSDHDWIVTYELEAEVTVVVPVSYYIEFGPFVGGGARSVVRGKDDRLYGGLDWFASLGLLGRLRIPYNWWLEAAPRLAYPRVVQDFSATPTCAGSSLCGAVHPTQHHFVGFDLSFGIRHWF